MLNRIGCSKKKRKKSVTLGSPITTRVGSAERNGMTLANDNVELGDVEGQSQDDSPKKQRPSTAVSIIQVVRDEEDENQETWKEIARALDRIFFWLFLALFVVSSLVVYGQAGRLRSFDKFDD